MKTHTLIVAACVPLAAVAMAHVAAPAAGPTLGAGQPVMVEGEGPDLLAARRPVRVPSAKSTTRRDLRERVRTIHPARGSNNGATTDGPPTGEF